MSRKSMLVLFVVCNDEMWNDNAIAQPRPAVGDSDHAVRGRTMGWVSFMRLEDERSVAGGAGLRCRVPIFHHRDTEIFQRRRPARIRVDLRGSVPLW